MKIYNVDKHERINVDGVGSIPRDPKNKDYSDILREIKTGKAEVVEYVKKTK